MPQLQRVLFVDDEANILAGLQRMLRPMRQEWDMQFVTSGAEALDILARMPFDVIVTDMRMPEMDGAELLDEVSRSHPGVVRIVLSGQSNRDALLRVVGPAHQYLAKPCDPEELKATLRKASVLRHLLANDALKSLVARLRSLPSAPAAYLALMREMRSKHASLRRIAEIVEQDTALTAKVLQLANSAFFGVRVRVGDAEQAVQLLGLDLVCTLMLSSELVSQLDPAMARRFLLSSLWERSLIMTRFVRRLARLEGLTDEGTGHAVTAAVLQDAGRLVLALCLPDEYGAIVDRAVAERQPLVHAEQGMLGCTHAEVGAYLLGLWGLPDPVTTAVAGHHQPSSMETSALGPLALVHAADAITSELIPQADHHVASPLDREFLVSFRPRCDYDTWTTECRAVIESP